jgi:hypothetical protein
MDDYWSVVGVAAAVASAFAAIVSTGLVLLFRYRDRPVAEWIIEPLAFRKSTALVEHLVTLNRGPADKVVAVTNVGDGAATSVRAYGSNCAVLLFVFDESDSRSFRTPSIVARVQPTEVLGVFVWHNDPAKSNESTLLLEWSEMPLRHARRRLKEISIESTLKQQEDEFNDSFGD